MIKLCFDNIRASFFYFIIDIFIVYDETNILFCLFRSFQSDQWLIDRMSFLKHCCRKTNHKSPSPLWSVVWLNFASVASGTQDPPLKKSQHCPEDTSWKKDNTPYHYCFERTLWTVSRCSHRESGQQFFLNSVCSFDLLSSA